MKILSIQLPWAALIVLGYKDVENRVWATNFRGRFAVHAGKKVDSEALSMLRALGLMTFGAEDLMKHAGCIIGTADLFDCRWRAAGCLPTLKRSMGRLGDPRRVAPDFSDWHAQGQFGFYLRDQRLVKPVPLRGRLKFFDAAVELEAA